MSFDRHLFISYAHIDNKPLTPDQEGWITQFHTALDAFLSMRMGAKAQIWRDERLQGNDVFADEIVDQFPKTAVLVSILTPRYVNSEWCTREVTEFCKSAEQSGGVVLENKARVFKVIKTPVDAQDCLPSVLDDVLGYEFFTDEDGAPLELDPAENPRDYKRKINKLAWDIATLLKKVESESPDAGSGVDASFPEKPTVYLAECSYDRKQDREVLEGELKRHGYPVLPEQSLPREEEEYIAVVKAMIDRAALAIHLVGDSYGAVPDGPTTRSTTMLQNELAAQRSKEGDLLRVIWLPEGTRSEQAMQQEFIDALHQDAEAQFGADLITGDLEELKTSIHSTLKKLEEPEPEAQPEVESGMEPAAEADPENKAKLIYLICNEKDRKATVPLRKFFRAQGFDVGIPAFEGDATTVRAAHQQQMANCDAVIVFYGAGEEAWKRTIDNDLKKMPGYRAGKPLLAHYTYLAAPATADKEDLIDMEEPNLIDGRGDFSEAEMAGFVQTLNAEGAPS